MKILIVTHCDLLKRFKQALLENIQVREKFGATSPEVLGSILQKLGYTIASGTPRTKVEARNALNSKAALICAARPQGAHCWRFGGLIDDESIWAMSPGFQISEPKLDSLPIDGLIKWNFSYIIISNAQAGGKPDPIPNASSPLSGGGGSQ